MTEYGFIRKDSDVGGWVLCYLDKGYDKEQVRQLPDKGEVVRQMNELKNKYPNDKYRLLVVRD